VYHTVVRTRIILLTALALTLRSEPPRLPAFPGAEGAGAYATGGRKGAVYHVTNVDAKGQGSLADAVSQPNRIIVFDVSGTIEHRINITQPNLTIAGQTAPGQGICIRGGALQISAGNIIVRHIRVRRGFNKIGDMGDCIDIKGHFENVIVDHVSTAWATDENLTLTNANHVTAQYSIAAEGLDYFNPNQSPNQHSEGSLFGSAYPAGEMTIHHTLYAHNRLRNARTTGGADPPPNLDFRNNVIYDWNEYATHTGSQAVHLNLVNNYYREGPSTSDRGIIFTFVKAEPYRLFAAGNFVDGYPDRTRDNWLAIHAQFPGDYRSNAAFPTPPVTTNSAGTAYEVVLAEAGATLPARDAVDLRIVNDVRNRTGAIINYETDIPEPGRWQTYHSLPKPVDSDNDGIPDYWAKQFNLAANSALQDADGDGYLNIEEYFNNTDPAGGKLPLVYVSASPGEILLHRTGDTAAPLVVRYLADSKPGSATIRAGRESVSIPVSARTVATVAPDPGYHIGCPIATLVAAAGPLPPVDIERIDPSGAVSPAVRKLGEENMKQHKLEKPDKKAEKAKKAKKD
jgi:hypothetical protein